MQKVMQKWWRLEWLLDPCGLIVWLHCKIFTNGVSIESKRLVIYFRKCINKILFEEVHKSVECIPDRYRSVTSQQISDLLIYWWLMMTWNIAIGFTRKKVIHSWELWPRVERREKHIIFEFMKKYFQKNLKMNFESLWQSAEYFRETASLVQENKKSNCKN